MYARIWMRLHEQLAANSQRSGHYPQEGYPASQCGMRKSNRLGMFGIDDTLVGGALTGGLTQRELWFIQIAFGKL